MDFDSFLNKAWNDHAEETVQVAESLYTGQELIEKEEQVAQLCQIITHVFGEHLGRWAEGVELLEKIRKIPAYTTNGDAEAAIRRSQAVLKIASGERIDISNFTLSEQIRVYASTATIAGGQNKSDSATMYLHKAIEMAETGIDDSDQANRVLAITGNNLACSLEENENRDTQQTELMIFAAEIARKYWEIAGSWLEVERAEYRLAMSLLKAKNLKQALKHAQTCRDIVEKNDAEPLEHFFTFEALALIQKQRNNKTEFNNAVDKASHFFNQLSKEDKPFCEPVLKNLKSIDYPG